MCMCVFCNVFVCFDNCVRVLVLCALVFTVFCIVSFMYTLFLIVLSILM